MKTPCGFEGPRGGGCNKTREYIVEAGDRVNGPHAMSGACEDHLQDIKAWAYKLTDCVPTVIDAPERSVRPSLL